MGHDPYWPTCLASINVLCVPVTAISSSRFNEIYQALRRVTQVELADLEDGSGLGNEIINPSNFRKGAAIFDFSREVGPDRIQRFPLEPNGSPQVVLGIYDQRDEDASSSRLQDLKSHLQSKFSGAQSPPTCKVLAIGQSSTATDNAAISLPNLDDESVYAAMKLVYTSVVSSMCHMSETLAEMVFSDPSVAAEPEYDSHSPLPAEDGEFARQSAKPTPQGPPQHMQKGRYTLVIGLLNLYLGSWQDAMRRLSEGAILARENQDPLWQARALECLLVCMLLLSWRGVDFDIPEVCTQTYNTSQSMARASLFGRPASVALPSQAKADAELSPIQKWAKYSPVIAQAILSVYSDLSSTIGLQLPQTILTESRIRVINLLIFSSNEVNASQAQNLELFILDRKHPAPSVTSSTYATSTSIGANIPNLLLAAIPKPSDTYLNSDETTAIIATLSCLSSLGSLRRHAFILRGLLQRLGPTLVRARRIGASEAGVHPESALSALHSASNSEARESPSQLRPLLDAATAAYGMTKPALRIDEVGAMLTTDQVESSLKSWCEHHIDGDTALKTEVLMQCIHVSDALPDPAGRLEFTSMLLRLAVQSVTMSANSPNSPPNLSVNEQTRLVEGLKRTTDAAQKSGLTKIRAPFWDDFLVRDIQIFLAPNAATLTSHAPSELSLVDAQTGSGPRDPFLFNPFARNTTIQAAPVVVAEEVVTFSVLLQNPLEVEIDISNIELAAEGCAFEPSRHSVVLGPMCAQVFKLTGKALSGGSLKIIGCTATIEGCYSQTFPILTSDWRPPLKVKQKTISSRRRDDTPSFSAAELSVPEPRTLALTVIEPQPLLEVVSSSLAQPSLMLLEGEKRVFSLRLKNVSATVPSDFLLFSSNDNVSKALQQTLSRKDLMPVDTYEVQHQLKHRPVVQVPPGHLAGQGQTDPREISTYEFAIWGRPGLTDAAVHIDFARLGMPRSEIHQTFYTRQARFPLALTVNGSIDIVRCNVLPIQGNLPSNELFCSENGIKLLSNRSNDGIASDAARLDTSPDGLCMLTLDLRNVWPQPLSLELTSYMQPDAAAEGVERKDGGNRFVVSEVIQPGHINRVILLVPKLFIDDPVAPIPNLDTKRQFVVSASKMGLAAEAATRENFWYREELLKHLHGTWSELKTGRSGEIDLRKGIRLNLNARMIDVLRVDHVEISYSLAEQTGSQNESSTVKQLEDSHYSLQTESFATLRVRVRNRSKDKLALLLRLQPSLREQPHNVALDLSRRLAWSGVLQRVLHPPLEPGEERTADLGLVAFAAGLYDMNATVEEVRARGKSVAESADGLATDGHRRLWHARSPCLIDAVDRPTPT